MLDFRNLTFSSSNLPVRAIMPQNPKFRLNWTIWSRVIAKKWFSMWRPSAILNLGISEFIVTFPSPCSIFAFAYQISSNSDDSRLRYRFYNDFQNGDSPPCWFYCDVIILYRKTDFNVTKIQKFPWTTMVRNGCGSRSSRLSPCTSQRAAAFQVHRQNQNRRRKPQPLLHICALLCWQDC